jgi:hypothetical protein
MRRARGCAQGKLHARCWTLVVINGHVQPLHHSTTYHTQDKTAVTFCTLEHIGALQTRKCINERL